MQTTSEVTLEFQPSRYMIGRTSSLPKAASAMLAYMAIVNNGKILPVMYSKSTDSNVSVEYNPYRMKAQEVTAGLIPNPRPDKDWMQYIIPLILYSGAFKAYDKKGRFIGYPNLWPESTNGKANYYRHIEGILELMSRYAQYEGPSPLWLEHLPTQCGALLMTNFYGHDRLSVLRNLKVMTSAAALAGYTKILFTVSAYENSETYQEVFRKSQSYKQIDTFTNKRTGHHILVYSTIVREPRLKTIKCEVPSGTIYWQ